VIEHIVGHLADKGWCVLPGFLSDELVHSLAQDAEDLYQSGVMRPAAIGQAAQRDIHTTLRGDNIAWLDEKPGNSAQAEFLSRMEELRLAANRELQLGLFDLEAHFARYPAGARYQKHLDVFQQDSRRTLSVICYLNSAWQETEGGQLRLYLDENGSDDTKFVDILPVGGTLACFLSHRFAHEVLPATRSRLSLTGWFRRRA
jgi:SM-20-related protein